MTKRTLRTWKTRIPFTGLGLAAVVVLAVTLVPRAVSPHVVLTAGQDFTITGQLSSSPSPTATAAAFYPGAQRYLVLTVTNPQQVTITINSLGAAVAPTTTSTPQPADCPTSDLDLSEASFTGALNVPPDGGTAQAWLPVSLEDTHTNQDGCEGALFYFDYSGTAQYSEVYATSTAVASSKDPSIVGQSVTYTATVAATAGANQDPVPSSPTGVVTFDDGTTIVCSDVPVTSTSTTTSTASCPAPTYEAAGPHAITAIYQDSSGDGNFAGSTSGALNQTVSPAPTTTSVASSPSPSTFGQTVTLMATVTPVSGPTPTGTVTFYVGTPTGSHTLLGTAGLNGSGKAVDSTSALPPGSNSLYATYGGSANDTSSTSVPQSEAVGFTVACAAGTINGGYTVKAGTSVCISGTVNGGLTVQAGGAVFVNGATVNGGFKSSGATALRVCGSTVNGAVTLTGSTGLVVIGDGGDDGPPGCAGNVLDGALSLTSNSAGFELAGNHVNGAVTISGNAGSGPNPEDTAPEVEGNAISGALGCSTDNPAPVDGGQANSVTGAKTGQCSGTGF